MRSLSLIVNTLPSSCSTACPRRMASAGKAGIFVARLSASCRNGRCVPYHSSRKSCPALVRLPVLDAWRLRARRGFLLPVSQRRVETVDAFPITHRVNPARLLFDLSCFGNITIITTHSVAGFSSKGKLGNPCPVIASPPNSGFHSLDADGKRSGHSSPCSRFPAPDLPPVSLQDA